MYTNLGSDRIGRAEEAGARSPVEKENRFPVRVAVLGESEVTTISKNNRGQIIYKAGLII